MCERKCSYVDPIDALVTEKGVSLVYLKNEVAEIFNKKIDGNFQLLWKSFEKMYELSAFVSDYNAQKTFLLANIKYC